MNKYEIGNVVMLNGRSDVVRILAILQTDPEPKYHVELVWSADGVDDEFDVLECEIRDHYLGAI